MNVFTLKEITKFDQKVLVDLTPYSLIVDNDFDVSHPHRIDTLIHSLATNIIFITEDGQIQFVKNRHNAVSANSDEMKKINEIIKNRRVKSNLIDIMS